MKKINFNDRYGLTQAVIEGRKTMMRRLINLNSTSDVQVRIFAGYVQIIGRSGNVCAEKKLPYKVGEVVAVAQSYEAAGFDPGYCIEGGQFAQKHAGWHNKMFVKPALMPHRIRITGICCERLQDISDEDCLIEGIIDSMYVNCHGKATVLFAMGDRKDEGEFSTAREAFAELIDKVFGRGTWKLNPWVAAYEFKLI